MRLGFASSVTYPLDDANLKIFGTPEQEARLRSRGIGVIQNRQQLFRWRLSEGYCCDAQVRNLLFYI